MRTKKKYLKLLKLLHIKRCDSKNRRAKREALKANPAYIFNNRGVKSTVPENWLDSPKIFTCQDGTLIPYGYEDQFKQTGEALEKLAKDSIKGNTIEEDYLNPYDENGIGV